MSILGADASTPLTDKLVGGATYALGSPPAFFGRYFKGPHNLSAVQYQPDVENSIFAASGIGLLCIGRQTLRVGGTNADGVADGVNNMNAVIAALGVNYFASLTFDPLIFLDVEINPSMSDDYFEGWSAALRQQGPIVGGRQLRMTPGIYINRSATESWAALGAAMNAGAECYGAWVADYGRRTGAEPPPVWDVVSVTPDITPACKIVGWQYAGNYDDVFDFSVLDDELGSETLSLMPMPPSSATLTV